MGLNDIVGPWVDVFCRGLSRAQSYRKRYRMVIARPERARAIYDDTGLMAYFATSVVADTFGPDH